MKVDDLKWYSPFVFLVGTILSFADPITDILTLAEFYRAGHKVWFGVGLTFVIAPCIVFPVLYCHVLERKQPDVYSPTRKYAQSILCGFHPFSAAFVRLQCFVFSSDMFRCRVEFDPGSINKKLLDLLLMHMDYAVLFESVLESAPQFVIQLYAISVQEEPVKIIQIISLPISFVSLAWAFTSADERLHEDDVACLKVKHKLGLFVTHLFLLSSRLFSICFFTVSFKWWVISVLLIHSLAMEITNNIWYNPGPHGCEIRSRKAFTSLFYFCLHWLRDDVSSRVNKVRQLTEELEELTRLQLLANFLYVAENFVMILLFHHSGKFNTWYSIPVTVCVCLFSVLGAITRVILFRWILKGNAVSQEP